MTLLPGSCLDAGPLWPGSACTAAAGRGYGTAVGQSTAATAAGGVYGFSPALTSFVGRAGAIREIAGLLEGYRLVTGPGGAGKTRLAGGVAAAVAGRFADGVWLAELAPVADPAQVAAVVAAALGVRQDPECRPRELKFLTCDGGEPAHRHPRRQSAPRSAAHRPGGRIRPLPCATTPNGADTSVPLRHGESTSSALAQSRRSETR